MVMQKIRLSVTLLITLVVRIILPMNEAIQPERVVQTEAQPQIVGQAATPRVGYAYSRKQPVQINSETTRNKDEIIKPGHPARLGLRTQPTEASCQGRHQSCTSDEPKNLELAKRKIKTYYEYNYIRDVTCIVNQIKHYIDTHAALSKNDAVVFDIDDTVISSFDYAISTNFGHSTKSYHEWEPHPKRPIPPMLDLYNFIINKGIKVFFVTGRSQLRRKVTEDNLRSAGFTHWEKIYLRPQNDDSFSVAPYKTNVRREIESQGYRIIANIGDQESDLIGGFADKTFKLPNPMYTLY